MIVDKYIEIVCGRIINHSSILFELVDGNLEYGAKHTEISIWSSDKAKPIFDSTIIHSFIKYTINYKSPGENFDGSCFLADDNSIIFFQNGNYRKEKINNLRKNSELNSLAVIDGCLWACGDDAVIYKRIKKNNWISVDNDIRSKYTFSELVLKMIEYKEEKTREHIPTENSTAEWLTSEQFKYTDHRRLWRICGNRSNNIYACGSINTKKSKDGVLFHYDGLIWKRINIPQTTTLCAIYIDDSFVLIGGQDGHILKSLDNVNFYDISLPKNLMVINNFARHGDRIYIGSSDGLFQYTNDEIAVPDIAEDISIIAPETLSDNVSIDILDDHLLLTTAYSAYRYCFSSRKCELLLKFTNKPYEASDDE